MQRYVLHKVTALAAIAVVWLVSTSVYATEYHQWTAILLATTIFGYTHYLVGGVYQMRGLLRKSNRARSMLLFALLALISIAVCSAFYFLNQGPALSFLVIGYFLVHGYYNEITLFERQTNHAAYPAFFAILTLSLFALAMLAVGHESWFFDATLTFQLPSLLSPWIQGGAWVLGIAAALGAIAIAAYEVMRATVFRAWFAFILVPLIGVVVWAIVAHPLNYIAMFSLLLLYHFIVWFLFYSEHFLVRRRSELPLYIGLHVLIVLPFLLVFFDVPVGAWVDTYLLNSKTFIILTMVHITTAFMNESWIQKWFGGYA